MASFPDPLFLFASFHCVEFRLPLSLWPSRLETAVDRLPGPITGGGRITCNRYIHFNPNKEPDHCRSGHVWRVPDVVGAGMGQWLRPLDLGPSTCLYVHLHS